MHGTDGSALAGSHDNWRQVVTLQWRKFKRLVEFLAFSLFDLLTLADVPVRADTGCAMVHVELLGDYVLWRPYGLALAAHLGTTGQRVHLVLDELLAELARADFPNCELVFVSRRRLALDPGYRAHTLRSLRRLHVRETYLASCPRDCIVHDAIVAALGAPAWGFESTFEDRPWLDRAWNRRLYRRGLVAHPGWSHKDMPHRMLLHRLGVLPVTQQSTGFPWRPRQLPRTLSTYWILAVGSSHTGRRWPVDRFVEVANWLSSKRPDWTCLLVGSATEQGLADVVARQMRGKVINLVGRTSLGELQDRVRGAAMVLGNDSALGHLAASLGTPAVVVVGGGHHGRCYPYPSEASVAACTPTVVAKHMECFHCDWICRYRVSPGAPFPCIEQVDVASVCKAVSTLLTQMQDEHQ